MKRFRGTLSLQTSRTGLGLVGICLLAMGPGNGKGDEGPFADLPLPPKNYLHNGGFERGEEGWEYFANRRFGGVVQDEKYSGQACFQATGVSDDYGYFEQRHVPLTPGRTYTLSAWIKCAGFPRATEHSQVVNLANYGWTQSADLGPQQPDQDWTKYAVTFQAPPTAEVGGQPDYTLVIFWPIQSAGTVWVDDLQIEEGDQATAFTECFLGWAFEARSALRMVHQQAEEARANLSTFFRAGTQARPYSDPSVAKTLDAKAAAVLEQARALRERLKTYDELSTDQAQSLSREAEGLKKEVASLRFLYFLGNPYLPLSEVALPETDPSSEGGGGGGMKLAWTCLAGEQRAVAVNVANLTSRATVSRIVPGELFDVTRKMRMVGVPWVTSYSVPEIRGHVKPWVLYTDPLPQSDEAGAFFLSNGRVSQAILLLDTSALRPGEYRGSVEVASLTDRDDRRSLAVRLNVLPVRLPSIADKDISDVGAMADYALDSIGPLNVNTFSIPAQWLIPEFDPTGKGDVRVDFTRVAVLAKEYLRRCPDARFFFAFGAGAVLSDHLQQIYGLSPEDPLFRTFAAHWVQAVVQHFAALGVGPERLIFETVDEPSAGQLARAADWAEIIKAAEPKTQTQTYVTSFHTPPSPPSQGGEEEGYARLYQTHDIIAPGFTFITEESVAYLKQRGKKVWVYDCQNNGETFHPIAYYRLLPWLAWRYELDGWGHFSWLNSERDRNYEPWEGVAEQSLVYPNQSGRQVISRRWLALAAGTQDYRALLALKRLLAAAEERERHGVRSLHAVITKAEALLSDLPPQALALLKPDRQYFTGLAPGADPAVLDRFREDLAALAGELAAALSDLMPSVPATLRQEEGPSTLRLELPQPGDVTVRYLCDYQLPWRSAAARLPAGRGELPLPGPPGQRISRCLVEVTDDHGLITVASPFPLIKVEVDSTMPPYNPDRLNDGLALPGMKFEPEQGWISSGEATEHWVVAALDQPTRVSGIRLWWMTFYGLPQAYKIQVWDHDGWQDAPGFADWRAARAAVEEIPFEPVLTDRLRVLQKAGGGNKAFPNLMGLSEVAVY